MMQQPVGLRPLLLATMVAVAGCTFASGTWRGVPNPPFADVVKELEPHEVVSTIGYAVRSHQIYFAVPENSLDEVHRFYASVLDETWAVCPSTDKAWVNPTEGYSARTSRWANVSGQAVLAVSTVRREDGGGVQQELWNAVAIVYDPLVFGLVHRAYCDPPGGVTPSVQTVALSSRLCSDDLRVEQFRPGSWKKADLDSRGLMFADLICGGLLLGLDNSSLLSLLGPPDESAYDRLFYRFRHVGKFGAYWMPPAPPGRDCASDTWLLEVKPVWDSDRQTAFAIVHDCQPLWIGT